MSRYVAHRAPPGADPLLWLSEHHQRHGGGGGRGPRPAPEPRDPPEAPPHQPPAVRQSSGVSLVHFASPDGSGVLFARAERGAQASIGDTTIQFSRAYLAEDDDGPYVHLTPSVGPRKPVTVPLPEDRSLTKRLVALFDGAGVRHNLTGQQAASPRRAAAPATHTDPVAPPPPPPPQSGPTPAAEEPQDDEPASKFAVGDNVRILRRVAFGDTVVAEPGDTGEVSQAPAGPGKVEVCIHGPHPQWVVVSEKDVVGLGKASMTLRSQGRSSPDRRRRRRSRSRGRSDGPPEAPEVDPPAEPAAPPEEPKEEEDDPSLTEGQRAARDFEKMLCNKWLSGPRHRNGGRGAGDSAERGDWWKTQSQSRRGGKGGSAPRGRRR